MEDMTEARSKIRDERQRLLEELRRADLEVERVRMYLRFLQKGCEHPVVLYHFAYGRILPSLSGLRRP